MPYEDKFTALSHPLRQQILQLLGTSQATVRELTDRLDASQPVVSQHLKVLREAGLVSAKARGVSRLYSVETDGLAQLRAYLETHWMQVITAAVEEDPNA